MSQNKNNTILVASKSNDGTIVLTSSRTAGQYGIIPLRPPCSMSLKTIFFSVSRSSGFGIVGYASISLFHLFTVFMCPDTDLSFRITPHLSTSLSFCFSFFSLISSNCFAYAFTHPFPYVGSARLCDPGSSSQLSWDKCSSTD